MTSKPWRRRRVWFCGSLLQRRFHINGSLIACFPPRNLSSFALPSVDEPLFFHFLLPPELESIMQRSGFPFFIMRQTSCLADKAV